MKYREGISSQKTLTSSALAALMWAVSALGTAAAPASEVDSLRYKWVYISDNFMSEKNVDKTIAVLERAAKLGYNGIFLSDSKFSRWFESVSVQRPRYDNNVKKLRKACRDLHLKVFVSCCDQGTDMLSNDPNLAEGLPVYGAPFIVKGGRLLPTDELKVANPSFEDYFMPDAPRAWTIDEPGKTTFIDTKVKSDGKAALRMQFSGAPRNGRAIQKLSVEPFRYYHISVRIKTESFESPSSFKIAMIGKQNLMYQTFTIASTQDWTTLDAVVNTLDNTEVNFCVGAWGAAKGKLWIDDIKIDGGGFVNLLRRKSCPLTIKSLDGKIEFKEGKDIDEIKDARLGNTDWPGLYKYWYEQPEVRIPEGSRLREGDRVAASYMHAANIFGRVFASMTELKTMEWVEKNFEETKKVLEPDGYILPYDEIRVCGWDVAANKTPVQILKGNVKQCVKMIKRVDPGKPIFAWNDMFDPFHNATKSKSYYYLVKGVDPWYGSYEALDKDILILNWNGEPPLRQPSLNFFARRGHKQILCGFYDSTSDNMITWLKEASGKNTVAGVMYTTWNNDFSELEKFLKLCRTNAPR